MRAARYHQKGDPSVIVVEDIDQPVPQQREALIRVEAAGVNYADVVRRYGDHYPIPTPLPHVPGAELVGTVVSVGPDADPALVGQRVLATPTRGGAYAEYAVAPMHEIYPIPSDIDPTQAVALGIQGLTAALILREAARLQPGENVFIEGAAGGVGTIAVQLAKLWGANVVVGGASTEDKREYVRRLGADAAVDYTSPGLADRLRQHCPGGIDVVLEMTGDETFKEVMTVLNTLGRVIVYGIASRKPFHVPSERMIPRGHTVSGFYLGAYFPRRDLIVRTLQELCRHVTQGRLKLESSHVYSIEQARQAHIDLEARRTSGKVVIKP